MKKPAGAVPPLLLQKSLIQLTIQPSKAELHLYLSYSFSSVLTNIHCTGAGFSLHLQTFLNQLNIYRSIELSCICTSGTLKYSSVLLQNFLDQLTIQPSKAELYLYSSVQFSFPPAELPKSADGDGLSQTVSAKLLQSRYNINPPPSCIILILFYH